MDDIIDRKDEIVDALRCCATRYHGGTPQCGICQTNPSLCVGLLRDAADLIEAQAARIAELDAMINAARRDFRKIADGDRTWMCPFCAHCLGTESGIAKCEFPYQCQRPSTLFEWRGADIGG